MILIKKKDTNEQIPMREQKQKWLTIEIESTLSTIKSSV